MGQSRRSWPPDSPRRTESLCKQPEWADSGRAGQSDPPLLAAARPKLFARADSDYAWQPDQPPVFKSLQERVERIGTGIAEQPYPPQRSASVRELSDRATAVVTDEFADLRKFWFNENATLCAPSTTAFQNWLRGIASVEGPTCGSSASSAMPLMDRQFLEALYAASGGTHGFRRTKSKASPPLEDWFGIRSDGDGHPQPLRKENKHSQETP